MYGILRCTGLRDRVLKDLDAQEEVLQLVM